MIPTRDLVEILDWAQRYDARPAQISPLKLDGQPAILYFIIGEVDLTPELHPITWETFFAQLDLLGLSFAYDDCSRCFSIVRLAPSEALSAELYAGPRFSPPSSCVLTEQQRSSTKVHAKELSRVAFQAIYAGGTSSSEVLCVYKLSWLPLLCSRPALLLTPIPSPQHFGHRCYGSWNPHHNSRAIGW